MCRLRVVGTTFSSNHDAGSRTSGRSTVAATLGAQRHAPGTDGGQPDPLLDYERTFADVGNEPAAFRHLAGKAALRFPDPRGRRDSAGRVILHEFVVSGVLADEIGSIEDGVRQVWPLVAGAYAEVWDAHDPPSAGDLDFTVRDP
jgi:hypothetical protein